MSDPEGLSLKAFGDRIDALEARLTFQDDAIETLNKAITEQWATIDALTRRLVALNDRLAETETQLPPAGNEPPPHY
jgi:SlyX protein